MTPRQKEKARLIEQRDALRAKYPEYPKGTPGGLEPADVLRHVREVIRFNCKNHSEYYEVKFP